jgi:hypothetical protein
MRTTPVKGMVAAEDDLDLDIMELSAQAWRLLRVAAGYEQREVEKEIDDLVQAHISMLENDTRSLSQARLRQLLDLYAQHLTTDQIEAIAENF